MGIPQIIIIVLYAMGLGINLVKHGEPLEGKHNIVTSLIGTAIMIGLLIWGGFF